MKRLALAVSAIAALAALTACSDDSGSDDSDSKASPSASESTSEEPTDEPSDEPTEDTEPTEDAEGDPERFATAFTQVSTLFTELNSTQTDVQPTSTEEANAAAGLDDTTPLIFADYTVLPDDGGGSLCLESDTGTYIAVTFVDTVGEIDLGDGECSYETSDALVVGDIAADTWTTGADYMGDLLPTGVFGS